MSATAQKRSVPPPVPPHVLHYSRGPIIEVSRHRSTLLPPPNPIGPSDGRVPTLSELIEQIDSDVIVPDSSIVECAARLGAGPPLESQVTAVTAQERAEVDIQDYSLRLDNPYAPSSLVPPRPRSWGRTALLVATGAVAVAVAGLAGSTMLPRAPVAPRDSERPSSVVHAAPVSQAPLLSREPVSEEPVSEEPVSEGLVSEGLVGERPVTANPMAQPAPVVRAEKRASTPAKPRAPSRPQRARTGRKVSPGMVHERTAAPASADMQAASLPVTPTREQVIAGFSQVRGALARCAGGKSGVVEIQATILSTGRISTAMIGGDFEGTAEGSCMARAARLASFGRFTQPRLKVRFPMAL